MLKADLVSPKQDFRSLPTVGIETLPSIWKQEKAVRDSQQLSGFQHPNMWIVQGKLYDLSNYMSQHPGGQSWLRNTRGHDITQLFIVHHLNEAIARSILEKYYVKDCQKRIQRFSFQEAGLYRTVKMKLLKKYTPEELQNQSASKKQAWKIFTMFVLFVTAAGYFQSYTFAVLSGLFIIGLFGVMHNFLHHKHGPYSSFVKLTGFSADDFQILHCISHHVYVNTELDFQITGLEPLAFWLKSKPQNKIYSQWIIQPILALAPVLSVFMNLIGFSILKFRKPNFQYGYPLLVLLYMYTLNQNFQSSLCLWLCMYISYSFLFFKILLCEHRMPELWTQGEQRVMDFGQHIVNTTCDVNPSVSGFASLVLMAGFNIHVVHHFFPTVDHCMLSKINHILIQTCKQRNIKYHSMGRIECMSEFTRGMLNRADNKKLSTK